MGMALPRHITDLSVPRHLCVAATPPEYVCRSSTEASRVLMLDEKLEFGGKVSNFQLRRSVRSWKSAYEAELGGTRREKREPKAAETFFTGDPEISTC